jgi:hypothetical protein
MTTETSANPTVVTKMRGIVFILATKKICCRLYESKQATNERIIYAGQEREEKEEARRNANPKPNLDLNGWHFQISTGLLELELTPYLVQREGTREQ